MTRTPQAPLPSGYGPQTTARELLAGRNLEGTFAIVTGGSAGVGLETTRALAAAGAQVLVGARRPEVARAAVAGLERVSVDALDLADPASIDAFAARHVARPLQLLINNAGIMATPLARDPRGYESQFATNHLGHFQLTARLWPALRSAHGARVVELTSRGHARSPMNFEDPHFQTRPYDKWSAYGQSKTANALFAVALDERAQSQGVRAFAVHPGAIITDLMRSLSAQEQQSAVTAARDVLKTVEQGAATSIWCATSPMLEGKGGVYCEDVDIAQLVSDDPSLPRGVRRWAVDPEQAARLWTCSEEWTGVKFSI